MLNENALFDLPFKILHIFRMTNKIVYYLPNVTLFVVFGYTLFSITYSVYNASKILESLVHLLQISIRLYTMLVHEEAIHRVLDKWGRLWNLQERDKNGDSGAKVTIQFAVWFLVACLVIIAVVGSCTLISTLINGELLFYSCVPPIPFGYQIVEIIQYSWFVSAIYVLVAFDTLFIRLSVELYAHFKMLNYTLARVTITCSAPTNRLLLKMQEIVDYHNLLCGIAHDLRSIFATFLLFNYFMLSAYICTQLYIISTLDYSIVFKNIGFLMLATVLVASYSVISQAIEDEALETAFAAYRIEWYAYHTKELEMYIKMIMMRSQKSISYSGHGLVNINRASLANLYKMALSLFTILRTIQ